MQSTAGAKKETRASRLIHIELSVELKAISHVLVLQNIRLFMHEPIQTIPHDLPGHVKISAWVLRRISQILKTFDNQEEK